MPNLAVAFFGGRRSEILQNMYPHGAGPAPRRRLLLHTLDEVAQINALAQAHLAQRIPHLRLRRMLVRPLAAVMFRLTSLLPAKV